MGRACGSGAAAARWVRHSEAGKRGDGDPPQGAKVRRTGAAPSSVAPSTSTTRAESDGVTGMRRAVRKRPAAAAWPRPTETKEARVQAVVPEGEREAGSAFGGPPQGTPLRVVVEGTAHLRAARSGLPSTSSWLPPQGSPLGVPAAPASPVTVPASASQASAEGQLAGPLPAKRGRQHVSDDDGGTPAVSRRCTDDARGLAAS